jgi:hypothetical protein
MAKNKTKKLVEINTEPLIEASKATIARVPYSRDHVHNEWIKRAMSSIIDVSTGLLSKRSKSILLNDALDCLRLLDKAFEDTDELSKITFNVNEFMSNEMREAVQ